MKKIKVILADDNDNTRESIRKLIELDNTIDIVAEATNGKEVLDKVKTMEPDIVVMDINMPEMDGLETAKIISSNHIRVNVIIISVNDELQNMRRAMMAGAKEYLVKPLSYTELNATIKQVAQLNHNSEQAARLSQNYVRKGPSVPQELQKEEMNSATTADNKIVTVLGTKGGVGKSVICTNLAVAIGQKHRNSVGIVDLDIQFGDVSIMLNLNARRTIAELMQEGEMVNRELLEEYLYERNGINILSAPNKPEYAELITPGGVDKILKILRSMYRYTLVDTPSFIDDNVLSVLEVSDLIFLIISLDLPTIKNAKKGINILHSLNILDKTRLILNRSSGTAGIEVRDVEKVLDMKIRAEIPSDGKLVISSLNQGIPFIQMNPKAPISKGIYNIIPLLEEK